MPKITTISQFANQFAREWLGPDPSAYQELADQLEQSLNEHIEAIVGNGLTSLQAFENLIEKRGVHNELGIDSKQVRYYRHSLRNKKPIKESSIEEILLKAGYHITQERKWRKA